MTDRYADETIEQVIREGLIKRGHEQVPDGFISILRQVVMEDLFAWLYFREP